MTSSYCLSSTRNIVTPEIVLRSSHSYLYRTCWSRKSYPFKPHQLPQKHFLPILRLKNSKLAHPFASISSFTEAGGKEDKKEGFHIDKNQETLKNYENNLLGMAQAFHISLRTASAICIVISFAALSFPLFMKEIQSMKNVCISKNNTKIFFN